MSVEAPPMRASNYSATKNMPLVEIPEELKEELERRKAMTIGCDWTKEDWVNTFHRYRSEISFAIRLLEKNDYQQALYEVDECLALCQNDTGVGSDILVNNFFILNPDLKALKRDITLKGYSANDQPWWHEYDHDLSFFYFAKTDSLRQTCIALHNSQPFDNFILGVIFVSTVLMAVDSPYEYPDGSKTSNTFEIIEILINVIFTIEMFIRMIAMSCFMGPKAYLQDNWFRFDFIIVIFSWLALIDGIPNLKPFRAFRGLRSLKSVRFLTYCAAVLDALAESAPQFMDVLVLTLFLMVIFGIMGIQLMKCSLKQHCTMISDGELMTPETWCNADLYGAPAPAEANGGDHRWDDNGYGLCCPRGSTCERGQNPGDGNISFDNIGMAMFSIFQMLTLEGWTPIMYAGMQSQNEPIAAYFCVIIVVFAFVVVNLFIAVITTGFQNIRRRRDKEEAIQQLRLGQIKIQQAANKQGSQESDTVNLTTERAIAATSYTETSTQEQVEILMDSMNMKQYTGQLLELCDNIQDMCALTQADMEARGIKVLHARKISEAAMQWVRTQAQKQTPDEARVPLVDMDHLPPSQQILFFLRHYGLEKYFKEVTRLCDTMDDIRSLTNDDLAASTIKVPHQRRLLQAATDAKLTKVHEDDLVARSPELCKALGGESVQMWRNRMILSRPFWSTKFGMWLLHVWRRQDPMVNMTDPPPPAVRTKFIEPFQWDNYWGHIIATTTFEAVIQVMITVNVIFMAMDYYQKSSSYDTMLKVMEVFFCCVFVIEMSMKWSGMGGLSNYFRPFMNKFDFILVVSSIPSAIAILLSMELGLPAVSLLRVFRLFRLFRLMRQMRQLIDVVASSMMAISNLLVFIIFNLMIFAIFGMQIFAGKMEDADGETPRTNFNNFPLACLALFQVMTGEDWTTIMYDLMRYSVIAGAAFMLIFFILANFILMEMFVAVILENFQLRYEEKISLQQALLNRKIRQQANAKKLRDRLDTGIQAAKKAAEEKEEAAEEERREAEIRRKMDVAAGIDAGDPDAQKKKDEALKKQIAEEKIKAAQKEKEDADLAAHLAKEEEERMANEEAQAGDAGSSDLLADFDAEAGSGMLEEEVVTKKKRKLKPGEEDEEDSEFVIESCFCMRDTNPVRKVCQDINNHAAFEWVIFAIILTGSVLLAMDKPYKADPQVTALIEILDPTFLAIFCLEAFIKISAMGFYGKPTAYITDTWNRIDFFVVVMSLVAIVATVLPPAIPRVLRVFRCIRPLRLINQNENVKKVFDALFMSAPAIANVLFLGFFTVFLFAIMGMGLYMGLFYRCTAMGEDVEGSEGKDDCLGVSTHQDFPVPIMWQNPYYSFDNVFKGMLILFEISTLEGWTDVMYSCMDAVDEHKQPKENNSPLQAFFVVMFICIAPFFVLNMVIGVIIEKFNQISGRGILTDEQKVFRDTMMAVKMSDGSAPLDRPESRFRAFCYDITCNPAFEQVVIFLIVANTALMASEFCGQSDSWEDMLKMLNLMFVLAFTVELVMRLIAQYPRAFFSNGWQIFDFIIVVGSLAVLPLDGIVNLQALRPFRLMLIFRMIKRARGIKMLVGVLLMSLPAVINVSSLLFLSFFIFAVMGMQFFALLKYGNAVGPLANFRTFGSSISMLYRGITGEGWNAVMNDMRVTSPQCTDFFGYTTDGWGDLSIIDVADINGDDHFLMADCGSNLMAPLFWIMFILLASYAVLNLFIAVILDNFAFCANCENAEISEFSLKRFHEIWFKHTKKDKKFSEHGGKYLSIYRLNEFLSDLGQPLGILVWDSEGRKKYKMIVAEARRHMDDKGFGVSYRKMQLICANYAMSTDIFPLEDRHDRETFIAEVAEQRAAELVQGMWRGRLKRRKMGITNVGQKSESEKKAAVFKSRFMALLTDPNQAINSPRAPVAPGPSPLEAQLQPKQDAVPTMGNSTNAPTIVTTANPLASPRNMYQDAPSPSKDISEVRNVFRERAAKRKEAREKRDPTMNI